MDPASCADLTWIGDTIMMVAFFAFMICLVIWG